MVVDAKDKFMDRRVQAALNKTPAEVVFSSEGLSVNDRTTLRLKVAAAKLRKKK